MKDVSNEITHVLDDHKDSFFASIGSYHKAQNEMITHGSGRIWIDVVLIAQDIRTSIERQMPRS